MNDGDIYFWRYADEAGRSYSELYHCKSRKAVVIDGRLVDTFWSSSSDGTVLDPSRVVLEFKGNTANLRTIREWEVKYYDEQDVVDMRHSNSWRTEIYVKADESVIRCAEYKLELLAQSLTDVMDGKLDQVCV
jgi:hypothetical protein